VITFAASRGSTFTCKTRDLSTHVFVSDVSRQMSPQTFAAEVAEFVGWHAIQVYPTLNGFNGYDTLRFHFGEAS
jgi:hypothetical protein